MMSMMPRKQPTPPPAVIRYLRHHLSALQEACKQCWRAPLASVFTVSVLGIALALPLALWVVLTNLQTVTHRLDNTTQVSLFLKENVTEPQALTFAQTLRQLAGVTRVTYISPAEGLAEFQRQLGVSDVLTALNQNPLPAVLVVYPSTALQSPAALSSLIQQLATYPAVASVQSDMQWIKRLYGVWTLGQRMVWVLAALLSLGGLLVIGNTIRLAALQSQTQVTVIQLAGGSASYIRRPFLYTGMLYGVCGAAIACFLIDLCVRALRAPVQNFAALYSSDYVLTGLSPQVIEALVGIGAFLGLSSAWFAVSGLLHLRRI